MVFNLCDEIIWLALKKLISAKLQKKWFKVGKLLFFDSLYNLEHLCVVWILNLKFPFFLFVEGTEEYIQQTFLYIVIMLLYYIPEIYYLTVSIPIFPPLMSWLFQHSLGNKVHFEETHLFYTPSSSLERLVYNHLIFCLEMNRYCNLWTQMICSLRSHKCVEYLVQEFTF